MAAALVQKAVGDQLLCVFVDTGMMRRNERRDVEQMFRDHMGIRLVVVDASAEFLSKIANIAEPEHKRKVIGETFIRVFERAAREFGGNARFLVQGTLYPDVIESLPVGDRRPRSRRTTTWEVCLTTSPSNSWSPSGSSSRTRCAKPVAR